MLAAQWLMTVLLGVWWVWWMGVALMVMLAQLDDVPVEGQSGKWRGVGVIAGWTAIGVGFTLFCAWIVVQFIWMQCVALCG